MTPTFLPLYGVFRLLLIPWSVATVLNPMFWSRHFHHYCNTVYNTPYRPLLYQLIIYWRQNEANGPAAYFPLGGTLSTFTLPILPCLSPCVSTVDVIVTLYMMIPPSYFNHLTSIINICCCFLNYHMSSMSYPMISLFAVYVVFYFWYFYTCQPVVSTVVLISHCLCHPTSITPTSLLYYISDTYLLLPSLLSVIYANPASVVSNISTAMCSFHQLVPTWAKGLTWYLDINLWPFF